MRALALAGILIVSLAAGSAAERSFTRVAELEMPCPAEEVVPETLTWPISLLVQHSKLGRVTEGGGRRFTVEVRAANGSHRDRKARLDVEVLDAGGATLAAGSDTRELEEGDLKRFKVKLDLAADVVDSIVACRLELSVGD